MQNEQNNEQNEDLNIDNYPSTVVHPLKKTMSEAATPMHDAQTVSGGRPLTQLRPPAAALQSDYTLTSLQLPTSPSA